MSEKEIKYYANYQLENIKKLKKLANLYNDKIKCDIIDINND